MVTGLWPHLQILCVGLFWCLFVPFCRLGFWSHPLPSLVPRWASSFGVCWTWVGRLRSCLGSCLLLVGNSPSLVVVVFAWQFLLCVCPGSLCFSGALSWGSSSRFQFFADSSGWLRITLGYPPSLAWRRCVLPWFSVRALSACPRGAAMPLGASVLQCSWSSRWGHLSQVELCSSSVLDRHEVFPYF